MKIEIRITISSSSHSSSLSLPSAASSSSSSTLSGSSFSSKPVYQIQKNIQLLLSNHTSNGKFQQQKILNSGNVTKVSSILVHNHILDNKLTFFLTCITTLLQITLLRKQTRKLSQRNLNRILPYHVRSKYYVRTF